MKRSLLHRIVSQRFTAIIPELTICNQPCSTRTLPTFVASSFIVNYCKPPFVGLNGKIRRLWLCLLVYCGAKDVEISQTYYSRVDLDSEYAIGKND